MPGARVGFLGALLNWRGEEQPTYESIAGAPALDQGVMHIMAITETGGVVLGNRALELDGVEPWLFGHGNDVQRGFTVLRRRTLADRQLPTLGWWGYDVIQILANKRLLGAHHGVEQGDEADEP
jgi:hypothetical protein